MNGSVIGWVVLVVGAWSVAAVVVGVLVGSVLRLRERQVPRSVDLRITGIPAPRCAPDSQPDPGVVSGRDGRRDPELRGR